MYTDKFYTCDGTKWSASTKIGADTYTHACEHGSIITGNVTKDQYKCLKEKWYGYECNDQFCEVVFSVSGQQIQVDEIELDGDSCMAVSGTWENQYYQPTIKIACSLYNPENIHLTLYNGHGSYSSSNMSGFQSVQIEVGTVAFGPIYYGNICVSYTGTPMELIKCRITQ